MYNISNGRYIIKSIISEVCICFTFNQYVYLLCFFPSYLVKLWQLTINTLYGYVACFFKPGRCFCGTPYIEILIYNSWLYVIIITYTHFRVNLHSIVLPVWLDGWVFVYELSGCGFESHWLTTLTMPILSLEFQFGDICF